MSRTAKTAKAETVATDAFAKISETIESVQSKLEVPAAARDFVSRTAGTVKERAEQIHEGAASVTDRAERLATAVVGGYANVMRGLIDLSLANVQHALTTVEKVAGAKSLNEAVQIQADYVRESARANFERARSAAETARDTIAEGAKTVQAEVASMYSKAA